MQLDGHASQFSVYATVVALLVISGVAVGLRLITRLTIARQFAGVDDVLVACGWVFAFAMGVSNWKQASYGMGLHRWLLDDNGEHAFSWFWNFLWLYYASISCTKLSILFQYLRIFPQILFQRLCYALIAVISAWTLWSVISGIFTCLPVHRFWTDANWDTTGCLPRVVVWYFNSAFNFVTDCITVALPLPILHQLEVPGTQKIVLMCVFAVGFFTCLISVLRMAYIYPVATDPDLTWQAPLATIWSVTEVNTAIFCACVPTLKGLVNKFAPKLLSSIRSQNHTPAEISEGYQSTEDSVKKSKAVSSVTERSYSRSRKSKLSAWLSSRDSTEDADSLHGIMELADKPGQSRPRRQSEDHNIRLQTSVDQYSIQETTSEAQGSDRYAAVQGSSKTRVSGAGTPIPWNNGRQIMDSELQKALGMRQEA
ncbi:hypothetical protein EJ03DRAFT_306754 [Teratosphaeria nubilosa]|uniref:Rhodopsin domain-containing protein n=1 Tax=Teratosphaeria nubilosa TaxID=161662 RepID=A0A6G1LIR2_9PEZI|nr:hypothetical protein EJ03DRAFT_306754 [Teratosphaeria nubilosa]